MLQILQIFTWQLITGCTSILLTADIPESMTYSRAGLYKDNIWFRPFVIFKQQTNPNNTIITIQVDELK